MKHLVVSTTLLTLLASPVLAADDSALKLELGGFLRAYGAYVSQDENGADINSFDMLRDTEIHFSGETTLDSGLTIGAHVETTVDSTDGDSDINESYLYFSGNWGRVNLGKENGAPYILQVSAPNADDNFDGMRQYIQPLNDSAAGLTTGTFSVDYANDAVKGADLITYISPLFSGLQLGITYAPEIGDSATEAAHDTEGNRLTNDGLDEAYEAAVRYEGTLREVGFAAGAGYTHIENAAAGEDDFKEWNIGLDLNIAAFGVGAVYTENNGAADDADSETWVVGADYTIGAYKIGASYLTNEDDGADTDTDRYAAGVTYSYAPGLSFRGSIARTQVDEGAAGVDVDGTAILLGTQVNF